MDSDSQLAMGCDGGTIPKRHELVKGPKKVEKVSEMGPVGPGGSGARGRPQGAKGGGRGRQRVSTRNCAHLSLSENSRLTTVLITDLY